MRLFCYYAFHSVLNTLKKLLKTWVAVFLVLCVGGALIGGIIGTVISTIDDENEARQEQTIDDEDKDADTEDADEDELEFSMFTEIGKFLDEHELTTSNVVDFVISVLFLVIIATNVANAKSSGKIFQPADVPMLFASPIKPQSVMMFRLTCSLGSSFMVSLFMLYQIPNLMQAGIGIWGAVSCIVVYMLSLMFSTLIQVTFYTITSKMKNGSDSINKVLIGIYGAIGIGFAAYVTSSGEEIVPALFGYFASPATHWIPFWGWIRGISYYACTGDYMWSLIYLGLFVASCGLIILFIWKMKADFYEDAMFAAERKAEQLENAQRASNGATVVREKERKGSIDREGFRYGSGANVFFYKAVFNRFRFAKLKIFSTTMIIYTLIATIVSYVAQRYTSGVEDLFVIPAAVMGVVAFYRTLGDPIREDTSREFFILIPAKGYSKIMWSLLGCLTVTAIDLAIPMIIAAVILGTNPLTVIVWFLFILSVSFFATVVGTFISLSIPGEHAKTIKTVIQIMFMYFGLGPSAIAVVAGIYFGQVVLALAIGAVINTAIGFLVSPLLPVFLGRK